MFELSDVNLGSLVEIDRMVKEMQYGQATIHVEVKDGQIRHFISNNHQHLKFRDDGAQDALKNVVASVQDAREDGLTGTITHTFTFKNGVVKEQTVFTNYLSNTIVNEV